MFLEKISSYNLFNYLFPGAIFTLLVELTTDYSFFVNDILISLFVYYFIGLVISRIGSIFLEPVFKSMGMFKFDEYDDYIKASKKDTKISVLSETNKMYRTLLASLFTLILLVIYEALSLDFLFLQEYGIMILVVFLFILFILAYRKQSQYIKKRVYYKGR